MRNLNSLARKRVQLDDFEVRWARFVSRRVYWLKKIAIEEEHEPLVIGLASETDYSSDTDTAGETEGILN